MSVKNLADAMTSIGYIEKLAIFCFTLIISVSIIYDRAYSLAMILFSFSMILHFFYIGFFRYEEGRSYPDKSNPNITHTVTSTSFNLLRRGEIIPRQLNFIRWISIILFILAAISFITVIF